jgi:hypothetical protein
MEMIPTGRGYYQVYLILTSCASGRSWTYRILLVRIVLFTHSFMSKPTRRDHFTGNNTDLVCCRFCNGGTVRQLMDNYNERATAILEYFIW